MGTQIEKWADSAMFKAEPLKGSDGPRAFFLQGTPDPLGSIAALSAMYVGKVVRDKRDVTDEERRYHLEQMKKTKLKAPLEAVNVHFMVEGVSRSFTHQMVRQRTAVYAQESLRFAVVEGTSEAMTMPPSLAGTMSKEEWLASIGVGAEIGMVEDYYEFSRESTEQQMRLLWDEDNERVEQIYNRLINLGMPAEDARGRLPHDIGTRLNYHTDLRALQDHAGNRLCTQAQFEWRKVWGQLVDQMRNYCTNAQYHEHSAPDDQGHGGEACDNWQWREISNLFRPVCYLTGKCEFGAEFDRKCSIRERVQANASIGRGSSEWDKPHNATGEEQRGGPLYSEGGEPVFIGGISPAEWLLDPKAAR